MSTEGLDYFGVNLMAYVRDPAIREWDRVLDGTAKGVIAQAAGKKLSGMTGKQKDALRWLIPQIVDVTLHHMLWWLDREESIDVLAKVGQAAKLVRGDAMREAVAVRNQPLQVVVAADAEFLEPADERLELLDAAVAELLGRAVRVVGQAVPKRRHQVGHLLDERLLG